MTPDYLKERALRDQESLGIDCEYLNGYSHMGVMSMMKIGICLLGMAALFAGNCSSNSLEANTSSSSAINTSPAARDDPKPETQPVTKAEDRKMKPIDACALIEKSEVGKVQSQKVSEAKSTTRDDAQFSISQCFYMAAAYERSVSLEVSERHPLNPDSDAVKHFWDERFDGARASRKKEKPKVITGVGEKAYWVGNDKVGSLYALERERIVRVSIGGPDTGDTKIQKSKTLVAKALKRLK